MNGWTNQIEEELRWREGEIASLKMLAAGSVSGSDRQRAVLRALWAMLYAHYEGFCQFCWDLLLDAIEAHACLTSQLNDELVKLAMTTLFKDLKRDMSPDRLMSFVQSEFSAHLSRPASFPDRPQSRSNLWPSLAMANNKSVGLHCNLFDHNSAQIKALVSRRNEIAHGKKMVIKDLDEYQVYENSTLLVMHELAVCVVDTIENKNYLRSTTDIS